MMLETSRLVLREMTPNDIDDLMTIFSDALAMRYYPSTKTVEEGLAWIHWNQSSYHEHGFGLAMVDSLAHPTYIVCFVRKSLVD